MSPMRMPQIEGLKGKLAVGAAYGAFFMVCFLMFSYWTFPYERVKAFILERANRSEGTDEGGYRLAIGELDPHWLTGVEATDVTIRPAGAGGEEGEKPQGLHIASLTANVSPFALMAGATDVDFGAVVGEGELEGSYRVDENGAKRLEAEIETLDLEALGLETLLGAPITGLLSGEIELDLPPQASGAAGTVDLRIEDFTLGDGKGKLKLPGMRDGFTVETIDAGTLTLKSTVEEGIAAIETLEAKGKDLELDAGGSIRLGYPLARSRLNMTLDLAFDEGYKTRNERTKSLFELMSFRPEIKRAMGPDGTMRFRLTGPANNLRTRPAGTGGKAGRRPRRGKPARRSR